MKLPSILTKTVKIQPLVTLGKYTWIAYLMVTHVNYSRNKSKENISEACYSHGNLWMLQFTCPLVQLFKVQM